PLSRSCVWVRPRAFPPWGLALPPPRLVPALPAFVPAAPPTTPPPPWPPAPETSLSEEQPPTTSNRMTMPAETPFECAMILWPPYHRATEVGCPDPCIGRAASASSNPSRDVASPPMRAVSLTVVTLAASLGCAFPEESPVVAGNTAGSAS